MLNAVVDRRVAAHPVDQQVVLVDQLVAQVDLEAVTLVTVEALHIQAVATTLALVDQAQAIVVALLHQQAIIQARADQAPATAGVQQHLAVIHQAQVPATVEALQHPAAIFQAQVDRVQATAIALLHQQPIHLALADRAKATVEAQPYQRPILKAQADQALEIVVDPRLLAVRADQAQPPVDQTQVGVDQTVAPAGLDQAVGDLIMMIMMKSIEVEPTLVQLQSLLMGRDTEDKG